MHGDVGEGPKKTLLAGAPGDAGEGPNDALVGTIPAICAGPSEALDGALPAEIGAGLAPNDTEALPLPILMTVLRDGALDKRQPVGVVDRELPADGGRETTAGEGRHVVSGGGAPVSVRRVEIIGVESADEDARNEGAKHEPRGNPRPCSCSRISSFKDFSKSTRMRRTWRATSAATGCSGGDLTPDAARFANKRLCNSVGPASDSSCKSCK